MLHETFPHHKRPKNKQNYQGIQISAPIQVPAPKPVVVHEPVHIYRADLAKITTPLPIAGLAKFPSPPPKPHPGLDETSHDISPLSPLGSHWSPEPSSRDTPQLPTFSPDLPSPLHVKKQVPPVPTPIDIGSPVLTTPGNFVNPPLQRTVSFAKEPERPNSGAPSSFVREVDEHFESPSSDSDRGVDEKYTPSSNTGFDGKKASLLQPGLGRIDRKDKTKSLDLDSIRAGPYSRTNTIDSGGEGEKFSSATSLDEFEQRIDRMIERHRARDVTFYLYALITSILALAALVLTALAVSQLKEMRMTPTTIVLQVPFATPEHSSALSMGRVTADTVDTPMSESTSSHPRNVTQSSPHLSSMKPLTGTPSQPQSTTALTKRDAPIALTPVLSPTSHTTPGTTSATQTSTTTPSHIFNSIIPHPPLPNIAARRFVAPLSWSNLKRWLVKVDEAPLHTTSTKVTGILASTATALPFAEQIVQTAYENGGVRGRGGVEREVRKGDEWRGVED